jgi:hypothetical protein
MRASRVSVPVWPLLITLVVAPATPTRGATATTTHAPAGSVAYTPKGVLPFIEDDYGRAVAEARSRKVPLFIESWAPW